jgi:hypothetical protein
MAQAESDEKRRSKSRSHPQPYSPSWVNHLTAWVDRRSWPSWSWYLGLWLVLVIIQIAALWIEGVHPVGKVFPAQLFMPAMIALFLAMIHFLDNRAEAALTTLRPALKATEEEYDQLRYQLTTLPAWPTILASLATMAAIYLIGFLTGETDSALEALAGSPIAATLVWIVYWIGWWVFGAFAYHSIHQLRQIDYIYSRHTRIRLFAMSPLYAFSPVTALTAVTLAIATYGWTALNPDNLTNPVSIALILLINGLALVVFAWPLLGTRRMLAKEKAQRLDQVSLRLEGVFSQMHERIDRGEIEGLEDLTKVMSVLETERDTLEAISTWPWQPETLRYLVTALLLPLLLWIIQYVVQLVVGS